jgi:hypothetical protein
MDVTDTSKYVEKTTDLPPVAENFKYAETSYGLLLVTDSRENPVKRAYHK